LKVRARKCRKWQKWKRLEGGISEQENNEERRGNEKIKEICDNS
jgi:hypothetical protein